MQSNENSNYSDEEISHRYNIIDNESLNRKIVLTDELINGYKDMLILKDKEEHNAKRQLHARNVC